MHYTSDLTHGSSSTHLAPSSGTSGAFFLGSGTAGSFGWKLDEVCGGGPSARKARWTLSVAGDTMIASIARGFKAGEPFTLKRCATR